MNNKENLNITQILNIKDEDLDKMNYKERQKYYKIRSKIAKIVHKSRDKKGKGITYKRGN